MRVREPGRHLPRRHRRLHRSGVGAHGLVRHERHRRDLPGPMARLAVLLKNRLDVFMEGDRRRLRRRDDADGPRRYTSDASRATFPRGARLGPKPRHSLRARRAPPPRGARARSGRRRRGRVVKVDSSMRVNRSALHEDAVDRWVRSLRNVQRARRLPACRVRTRRGFRVRPRVRRRG
jgi:hypothetical protein